MLPRRRCGRCRKTSPNGPPRPASQHAGGHLQSARRPGESNHDHRLSWPLHHVAAPARGVAHRADRRARRGPAAPPRPAISDDEIRASIVGGQLKLQQERGTDLTIFSPRAAGMGHHLGDAATSEAWASRLQRADPPRLHAVPAQLHRRLHAAADRRRVAAQLHRRAGTLRAGVRLRRLQPEPRSVRRLSGRTRRSAIATGIRCTRRWSSSTCRR